MNNRELEEIISAGRRLDKWYKKVAIRKRPTDAEILEWSHPASTLLPLLVDALDEALTQIDTLSREIAERDLLVATLSPAAPASMKVKHVGEIVRSLREHAGLTRHELGAQTGLADSTIRNLETDRHRATQDTLRKLLRAGCMRPLPERAKQSGFSLG